MIRVENPTSKTKAVRVTGGFEVVKPGGKVDVDMAYDDVEAGRYKAAGLKLSEAKSKKADAPADAARKARFAELVKGLTPADLTQAGKPEVDALNALLDQDEAKFTAAERDTLHEG